MAESHWDPGNLLQITEFHDNPAEIQCFGRAKTAHYARCRWTLTGSDAAAIMAKVRQLAASPPSKVTQRDLENLAKMCLCHKYHSEHWFQVVQDWKPVVAKAVRHHEQLSRVRSSANGVEVEKLVQERRLCLKYLDLKDDEPDLPGKLSQQLWREMNNGALLTLELSSTKHQLVASEDRRRALEHELESANARATKLAGQHRDVVDELAQQREAEHARQAEIAAKVDATYAQWVEVEAQVSELQRELEVTGGLLDKERIKTRELEETKSKLEGQVREEAAAWVEMRRLLGEASATMVAEQQQRDNLLAEEKAKSTRLEQENAELRSRLLDATTHAERSLLQERRKTEELQEANHDLEERLRVVEARAKESAVETNRIKQEKEALLVEHAAQKAQFEHFQADLNGIRAHIQRLTDHDSMLKDELHAARTQNHGLRSTHSELATQNSDLLEQTAALEKALSKSWSRRLSTWLTRKPSSSPPGLNRHLSTPALPPAPPSPAPTATVPGADLQSTFSNLTLNASLTTALTAPSAPISNTNRSSG